MQRHECCIIVDVVHIKEVSEKRDVKEILDGDSQVNVSEQPSTKVKRERQKDQVEYEMNCKGTSKPFSKIRVLFSYEFKQKGQEDVGSLLNGILELSMSNCGAYFRESSYTQPG
ncbi:hypothetical protein IGI04_028183 [Brassica rapa subsp. trilocularis]|uniref:Uncharacterized protein n=1 Tax=Brassica rapa subsp. trilocularis TaxID=1813537 RepID=A0ABQ7L176_BRACM|nr:hypothetical protein IGI04_028183 [Brassica rapa subsp. trilocularis]